MHNQHGTARQLTWRRMQLSQLAVLYAQTFVWGLVSAPVVKAAYVSVRSRLGYISAVGVARQPHARVYTRVLRSFQVNAGRGSGVLPQRRLTNLVQLNSQIEFALCVNAKTAQFPLTAVTREAFVRSQPKRTVLRH